MKMLRTLRKNKGLSMKSLGEIIGVAESTISQYETGKREPDFETLLKIAEYFNVSTDYLLRGSIFQEEPTLDEQLEGVDFALWGEIKELTDGQKEDILNFVRFTKEQEKKKQK